MFCLASTNPVVVFFSRQWETSTCFLFFLLPCCHVHKFSARVWCYASLDGVRVCWCAREQDVLWFSNPAGPNLEHQMWEAAVLHSHRSGRRSGLRCPRSSIAEFDTPRSFSVILSRVLHKNCLIVGFYLYLKYSLTTSLQLMYYNTLQTLFT